MKKTLKITDVTFRDGQQSIFATRMTTDDIAGIAEELNQAGYHAIEISGGATFEAALRFLNEDPWERIAVLKKLMPDTPLQMLLRGQSLVGYRHYADDVVAAFVQHAAETGIDIFRIFDALNDERNLESCLRAVKANGKHVQLAIAYTLTERKMGGPVYTLDYYVSKAKILCEMGADSICIKDMAGLMAPDDAFRLVQALKQTVDVPLELHTHYTSGMASMTCLKAIEAGIDILDTALAPLALRSSHPAVEPIIVALEGTDRETGFDLDQILKLSQSAETLAQKYREYLNQTRISVIDTAVLKHQIPGGMISNLVNQLRVIGALDRLDEVKEEIPRVRKDLGYPPLVTPSSQIIGVQAVQNVLTGRYKLIPTQVIDYCRGLYGRPPMEIDPVVKERALHFMRKNKPVIEGRPADSLEPEMTKARDMISEYSTDMGDILLAALFPDSAPQFIRDKQAPTV